MIRRIIVVGDSHTSAIKAAIKNNKSILGSGAIIDVYRYAKIKDGKQIGDLTEDQIHHIVSGLGNDDMVVSAIGGNQHQTISLIQHSVAFEFFDKTHGLAPPVDSDKQIIPYNVIYDLFWSGISGGDGSRLSKLKDRSSCQVFHLAPPPPKESVDHILTYHESHFKKFGLLEKGVSSSRLRLNTWRLQLEVLKRLTAENNIRLLLPPVESTDSGGFLAPDFYANDATHANKMYGELVVRQLLGCLSNLN